MNKIEEKNKKGSSEETKKKESPSVSLKEKEKEEEKKPLKKENSKDIKEKGKKGEETSKQEEASKKKESTAPSTVVEGSGINLIPTMSEEEVEKDERKKKVNLASLISLSLLFSVSILVIGFNIISRIQLNNQKEKLNTQEREIQEYSQLTTGNTEILERIFLYEDIQEGKFSTKLVIDHFRNLVSKSGGSTLNNFSFPGTKAFEFSGRAQSLEDVSKLWYLLLNDEKIESVELKSASRSTEGANFSFSGVLEVEEFRGSIGGE
jgi:hypothetical protein